MKGKITSAFQMVFATVILLTLLSGGSSVWLSCQKKLSPEQIRVFETCNTTWNMGIGAIFGLLGSKATNLFNAEEQDED
jgi:hypothetical protein